MKKKYLLLLLALLLTLSACGKEPETAAPGNTAGKIDVDIILQSVGRDDTKDISFTVDLASVEEAVSILDGLKKLMNAHDIQVDTGVAKVSIVGAGMATNSGVAAKMFEALADAGINIQMISTSEIKVSVLIEESMADLAVKAIHRKFFG